MQTLAAVDPGHNGAIVFMAALDTYSIFDMPTINLSKTKRQLDFVRLLEMFTEYHPRFLFVELLHPMPLGSNANFYRGVYSQAFRDLATVMSLPLVEVSPKTWQKEFSIHGKDGDTKQQAYAVASRLFPKADIITGRKAIKDGRCDALLIAAFAYKHYILKGQTT